MFFSPKDSTKTFMHSHWQEVLIY